MLTAAGPSSPPCDGKVASAAPAAIEAESAPPILVVFLVAKPGKPSWSAASARSCSSEEAT
jgi:hypothetical protein